MVILQQQNVLLYWVVNKANRILEAMKIAASEGKGAVSLDGRLIDYASIRQAEVLVEKANQIAAN